MSPTAFAAKPGPDAFALFVLVEQVVNRHAVSVPADQPPGRCESLEVEGPGVDQRERQSEATSEPPEDTAKRATFARKGRQVHVAAEVAKLDRRRCRWSVDQPEHGQNGVRYPQAATLLHHFAGGRHVTSSQLSVGPDHQALARGGAGRRRHGRHRCHHRPRCRRLGGFDASSAPAGRSSGRRARLAARRSRVAIHAGTASDSVSTTDHLRPTCSAHHWVCGMWLRLTRRAGSTGPTFSASIIGAVVNPSRRAYCGPAPHEDGRAEPRPILRLQRAHHARRHVQAEGDVIDAQTGGFTAAGARRSRRGLVGRVCLRGRHGVGGARCVAEDAVASAYDNAPRPRCRPAHPRPGPRGARREVVRASSSQRSRKRGPRDVDLAQPPTPPCRQGLARGGLGRQGEPPVGFGPRSGRPCGAIARIGRRVRRVGIRRVGHCTVEPF